MRTLSSLCAAFVLLVPSAALASGSTVVRDCTDDGKLSKRYSQSEYRDALANLPTDVDEYTDCRDVIRRAQLSAAGSGGSTDASGSGTSAAPAAARAVAAFPASARPSTRRPPRPKSAPPSRRRPKRAPRRP